MRWIDEYQLFLFDFDGLLVNTEQQHYQAYCKLCATRGCHVDWDFPTYCAKAHVETHGLERATYAKFPQLKEQEPDWNTFYVGKKPLYEQLLREGVVELMPGVEKMLHALAEAEVKRCVVTHSPLNHIQMIREQIPLLNTIPTWITRDDYTHPKPNPESYEMAIARLVGKDDRVIGFEDSPRGYQALKQTKAHAVLVCEEINPLVPGLIADGADHIVSFDGVF